MLRKPTSVDGTRRACVSQTTVSFILNNVSNAHISEETRGRVPEAAARQLGYDPNAAAHPLVRQQTHILSPILYLRSNRLSADAFLPLVMQGISSVTGPTVHMHSP